MTQMAVQRLDLPAEKRSLGINRLTCLMQMRVSRILCSSLLIVQITVQTVAASGLAADKRIAFTVPAAPWSLTLPANEFRVRQKEVKPDGRSGYFYITDEKQHLNVSFFIEPVGECKDSKSCRDMVWKAGNPSWENPKNVALSEIENVSVFEFLVPSFRGQPIQQQNMYAEFVVDGFWVDLHISKVLYQPAERKLFEDLVKAIKFEPKDKNSGS
jgi:hypothetical protein